MPTQSVTEQIGWAGIQCVVIGLGTSLLYIALVLQSEANGSVAYSLVLGPTAICCWYRIRASSSM